MRSIFVDSGAFFAHLAAEDLHHARATSLFHTARMERWRLVTTNVLVFETYTLLLNRLHRGRSHALAFLDLMEQGLCDIERITTSDEETAKTILRRHSDKTFSFFDALSFTVMERCRIQEAIAFDRDFRGYGRITIL